MSFRHVPLGAEITPSSRPVQRRATVRYRCPPATHGRVFIADSYKSAGAWIMDLSVAGVGLLMDRCLEPGTRVLIEIGKSKQVAAFEFGALVAHCTRQPDGAWLVGCAFVARLSDDDLEALL